MIFHAHGALAFNVTGFLGLKYPFTIICVFTSLFISLSAKNEKTVSFDIMGVYAVIADQFSVFIRKKKQHSRHERKYIHGFFREMFFACISIHPFCFLGISSGKRLKLTPKIVKTTSQYFTRGLLQWDMLLLLGD